MEAQSDGTPQVHSHTRINNGNSNAYVDISIFFHHQDLNRTFAQQFFKKRFYQLFGSRDKASGQT